MKTCIACNLSKSETEFYTDRSRPDQLGVYCKPCTKAKVKDYSKRAPRIVAPEGFRHCQVCKQEKPVGEFYAAKGNADGLSKRCKECARTQLTEWRKENPENHRASSLKWARANPELKKDVMLKGKYGIAYGTYAKMFEAQHGKCAICGTTEPGGKSTRFHVDHDHISGAVRGLLCSNCNTGIGQLKHDETLLQAAVKYLEATRK